MTQDADGKSLQSAYDALVAENGRLHRRVMALDIDLQESRLGHRLAVKLALPTLCCDECGRQRQERLQAHVTEACRGKSQSEIDAMIAELERPFEDHELELPNERRLAELSRILAEVEGKLDEAESAHAHYAAVTQARVAELEDAYQRTCIGMAYPEPEGQGDMTPPEWAHDLSRRLAELQEWQREAVAKAAEGSLDGYRELGAKAAAAENALDTERRNTGQWRGAWASVRDAVLHGLDGFDNDDTNAVLALLDANQPEIDRGRAGPSAEELWAIVDGFEHDACLTGDCPHRMEVACDSHLSDAYKEMAEAVSRLRDGLTPDGVTPK